MKEPLVSIIIPMYNTGKSCLELIKALQKSTYRNIEIICVDDGSTDDSYKIIRNYVKDDRRVILKKQKNAGVSAARNVGLSCAKGEWISFIDSDDLVDEKFIEKLVSKYDEKTILACTALLYNRLAMNVKYADFMKMIRERKDSENLKEYIVYSMLQDGRLYGATNKLFRKDIIVENKIAFDASLNFAEDTKFVLDYVDAAIKYYPTDCRIETIYEPLYIYNFGTETSTVSRSSLDWRNWRVSFSNLSEWTKDCNTFCMWYRKCLIWCRWRASHALAVARANISYSDKKKLLNVFELFIASVLVKIRK